MATFTVRWVERVECEVVVEAESEVEAEAMVWQSEPSEGMVRSRVVDGGSVRVDRLVVA